MKQVSSFLQILLQKVKKKIDILIGAEHYYRFIFGNVIRGKVNEPIAIESVFGWVLSGYYDSIFSSNNFNKTHLMRINTEVCDTLTEDTNFNSMKTLFEDRFDSKNDVENQCLQRLKNTLNYDGERYTSKLPFVKNPDLLPDNYILAKHRTDNLLKNLRKQPELLKEYDRIISEYIKEGILEEMPIDFKTKSVHYLPHRAVVKEDRETTKVRIDCMFLSCHVRVSE